MVEVFSITTDIRDISEMTQEKCQAALRLNLGKMGRA